MLKPLPSKQMSRVGFPYPAPIYKPLPFKGGVLFRYLIIKYQWLQKERILGKLMFDKSKVNDYVIDVYDKTVFMGYLDQDSVTDDINKAVSPKIRRDLQLYKDGWENYSYVLLDKTNPNMELGKVHKPLPYIYFGQ